MTTTIRTRRTTRVALMIGLLASLAITGSGVADAATKTPLNTNLVVNPGAEAGSAGTGGVVTIPGWSTTNTFTAVKYGTAGFPTVSESAELVGGGGSNFFACGMGSAKGSAVQKIKLVGRNALIDSGNASIGFGAYLGGTSNEGDSAVVIVRFLDADGKVLGKEHTHYNVGGNGNMVMWSAGADLPSGTRALRIILQGKRWVGSNCDAFFDNVYLNLFN